MPWTALPATGTVAPPTAVLPEVGARAPLGSERGWGHIDSEVLAFHEPEQLQKHLEYQCRLPRFVLPSTVIHTT